MKAVVLPTVPLSDDDSDVLRTIYSTRRNIFLGTCGGLLVIIAISMLPRRRFNSVLSTVPALGTGNWKLALQQFISAYWIVLSVLIIVMIVMFLKRIYCFAADCKKGYKECVPYVVTMKQYFETTGQYFIGLNDPDYLHHEVDADFYNQVTQGDTVVLHRALKSKYVFNAKGRFTLM